MREKDPPRAGPFQRADVEAVIWRAPGRGNGGRGISLRKNALVPEPCYNSIHDMNP